MFDQESLKRLGRGDITRLCVALSGGIDSVVLLHLVLNSAIEKPVWAFHINHGLQAEADEFTRFCETLCREWQVDLEVRAVDVAAGGSLETRAREARYAAFEEMLKPGDLLLLAHHADDQAETALFRLFRGSRAPGLEGMPREREIGHARLFRPLLDVHRGRILDYARKHELNWMDDPSNADISLDRNFIRHKLMPLIEKRFPGVRHALAVKTERDAAHLDELREQHRALLNEIRLAKDCLDLAALKKLEVGIQESVIDIWLIGLGLPLPGGKLMVELVSDSAEQNLFAYQGVELRTYKNKLYALKELPVPASLDEKVTEGRLIVPGGIISNSLIKGLGLRADRPYRMSLRDGGEVLRIRHGRSLKNLYQEAGVPNWLRDRIPLIFQENQLVAVAALPGWELPMLIADDWAAGADEQGWQVELHLEDRL